MKNYSIEIELIDKTGKSAKDNKNICKINDNEISKDRSGKFLLKEKYEDVEGKKLYIIKCGNKTIYLDTVMDKKNIKIDTKKTKLSVIENENSINIEKETIRDNIAWSIDEKNQIIIIKIIAEEQ